MNPLSPLTYYRRHKLRALLLTALITLAVSICLGYFQFFFPVRPAAWAISRVHSIVMRSPSFP